MNERSDYANPNRFVRPARSDYIPKDTTGHMIETSDGAKNFSVMRGMTSNHQISSIVIEIARTNNYANKIFVAPSTMISFGLYLRIRGRKRRSNSKPASIAERTTIHRWFYRGGMRAVFSLRNVGLHFVSSDPRSPNSFSYLIRRNS